LQFFHCLQAGNGGKSLYVDGFAVAEELKKNHHWAYSALSTIEISAHCAGDKSTLIQPMDKFSIIQLRDKQLSQIKYNNDDRSLLDLSVDDVELFYRSLYEWQLLLKSKKFEYWTKLQPGTCVMVDNWRVLHGRAQFSGQRRMIGSYHSYDDYQSKLKTLLGVNQKFKL
jgi:trimethyllysine dioxygenase